MSVLADCLALCHRLDHGTPEVLRVRRGEPDPRDPVDRVARAQQLAELGAELAAPGVDVLSEERNFTDAFPGESRHLGEDLARPSRDLSPAHGRDDAVRAL